MTVTEVFEQGVLRRGKGLYEAKVTVTEMFVQDELQHHESSRRAMLSLRLHIKISVMMGGFGIQHWQQQLRNLGLHAWGHEMEDEMAKQDAELCRMNSRVSLGSA